MARDLDLRDHELNDVCQLRLQFSLMANAKDYDQRWMGGCDEPLSLETDDRDGTAAFLEELADAVREGRVFGLMMQRMAETQLKAGEWEPDGDDPFIVDGKLHGIMPDEIEGA